jgi:type I restriction enzyme S subunit
LANASQVGVPAIARPSTTFKKVEIELPSLKEQKRIVDILNSLSDKIELNTRINHNLEEQIQERFDSMIISDNGLGYCQITDFIDVNPKRSLGKNEPAQCVDMSYLSTTGPFPSGWETKGYNGGMKFVNGDTIMARITPCLENGKVAYVNFLNDGEVAFGSTEYIVLRAKEGVAPVFTYFLARNKNFVDYATKNMNGSSGRQRVSGDTIGKYMIPVIDSDSLNEFSGFAAPAMEVIRNNSFESRSLTATRDALLPLLVSGELSISQMNC